MMRSSRLTELAERWPEQVVIVESRGREWTRAEFSASVNRLGNALRRTGLKPGDALLLVSPNCAEYLLVYVAALQIGLYVVPMNWHLSRDEIAYIARVSAAKALVVHSRHCVSILAALAGGPPPDVALSIGATDGLTSIEELMRGESDAPSSNPVTGRLMTFTAATTGRPKGIKRSLLDAEAATERLLQFVSHMNEAGGVGSPSESTHMCQSMLYHAAPLDCAFASLHVGLRIVILERWHPEEALSAIERYEVNTTVMVPAMFVRLSKLPADMKQKYSTASLRVVYHGAAPCPVDIKRQMIEWWGPVLHEIYGATEGGGTGITSREWLEKPGSVGRAHPGADIKIVSERGDEVVAGEHGIIYIRPYTGDRFEYLGDPEKTRAAYRGEYFTAGDIGYVDGDGYLYICDRVSDVIITGGINVYSAEIERVLLSHPAVADCAVVGVPDEQLGEAVVAVLETTGHAADEQALRADIARYLATTISPEKAPRKIEFVDVLPRDPAGKLFKRRIRDSYRRHGGAGVGEEAVWP